MIALLFVTLLAQTRFDLRPPPASPTLPLSVTRSGSILTIGRECSQATPCRVRFGGTVYSFTLPAKLTLSAGSGAVAIFVAGDGALIIGVPAVNPPQLACSLCTLAVGGFPPDSLPLAIWNATSGAWTSGVDLRALLSRDWVQPGSGLTSIDTGGTETLAVDPAAK